MSLKNAPRSTTPGPPRDLAGDARHRGGDAQAALAPVPEGAVSRIVVVALVAGEAEVLVDVAPEELGLRLGSHAIEPGGDQRKGEVIEPREERGDVEFFVHVAGEQGRPEGDVHRLVRLRRQLLE